jgi:hypothetical protein
MALHKIIEVEGKSVIKTSMGTIQNGIQKVSFAAYIKVLNVSGNKNQVTASVNFKNNSYQFTKEYEVPVSVENGSPNFIAQAYNHLKTLPDFAGATDC